MVIPALPNPEAVFLTPACLARDDYAARDLSALVINTASARRTRQQRYSAAEWDVAIAMTIAGFVNLAMMATAFHFSGHTGIADLDQAYLTLEHGITKPCGGNGVWCSLVAAGLHCGRDSGGAGEGSDAGFVRFHSAVGTAHHYHAALIYCDFDGAGPYPNSGDESGAAEFWCALALVPL